MPSFSDIVVAGRKSMLSLLGGRSIWGLGDQLLVSFTNFATMILVARGLDDPGKFGVFSVIYSAMLFANIIQFALVTQPHNVLGQTRKDRDYRSFTTTIGLIQLGLALALGLTATCAAFGAHLRDLPYTSQLIALVPSIVFWQLQEFIRRVMYTEHRLAGAFGNDIISYGGQTVLTYILYRHNQLTGANALWVLAITSAAACIVGFLQIFGSLNWRATKDAMLDAWRFGKWLLWSELLQWCSSLQMFLILAGYLIGMQASGTLRAVQILFGPARVFSFFLHSVLPIRFTRSLTEEGESALNAQMRRAFGLVSLLLGPYCILLALFPRLIITHVCGPEYASEPYLLSLCSAYSMMTYWLMVIIAALSAKQLTRDIFLGSIVGAVVALACCWPLIRGLGIGGVFVCLMVSTLAMGAYLAVRYRSTRRENTAPGIEEMVLNEEHACAS
jgi:O-antigen/teichoic acid export membrane protein